MLIIIRWFDKRSANVVSVHLASSRSSSGIDVLLFILQKQMQA